ncbi:Na+/H+ antiporter subunit G [Kurthia sibirica]|uniref:Na+/H+ antiporter subunit G n=1 Tax=Kurthia sibirica TaxID=202750 RepID=A0A2U3AQ90_9BACL|nr:Na+/H+ antiporter subunit G [Kurthia sibirica]PWI26689.1 Na+/H+ antiporter subunit G [Kurthia sibirica]GEK32958.1 Na(+)/H(+) antiporter subunit G [Kurthia sibirica]
MNANQIVELIAALIILLASIMGLISALGLIRMPDVYTRSHSATKSSTLAVMLALFGAFVYFWAQDGTISVRLLLGILFVFMTAPVAGHLICRAAYRSGVKLSEQSGEDALKDILFKDKEQGEER